MPGLACRGSADVVRVGPAAGSTPAALAGADRRDGPHTLPAVRGERRTRLTTYTVAGIDALIRLSLQPLSLLVWAAYNCALLALYRPMPGEHPKPLG
ncbi:hypothetical protein [Streptomyces sp. NPDC093111]|uniref:hypothetical protein n=1 Tax=Streptomyces sp. NPDC093111 TaxID=3154978 RepID=UPI00343AA275